ncbi:hypothetical protein BATDEDRAFT_19142 [Batrachochytrium dendrobatidis JAM81]|uniref:Mitochondrial distribution and morphology protein 31 n=1 Tax=Batrachochytrium dendrobatidis (strain JAM81 / FGSC 10211) TaxID=684364 RepID=F4P0C1_BATDJ|nr:uncharacterized protein BATDEDRAFT_19142 [Batrachochytrium dendrobatidis JAM81]EGF81116.1 hypothetical protein BATDEDRAFT_19142 [Batrachochytrium dendrobatidis JAM81]|eukprot:XP_006677796.1 hypothetical protein BATDEDRAFT_19142 [Batrachochytrium dendrobatidis JAM81]
MYRCWNLAITSIRGARRNSPSKLQSYSIVTYKPLHSSLLTLRNLKSFYTFNLRLNTCRLWTSRHLLSRYIHTTPSRSTKTASTLIPPQVDAAKAFRLARQELINNVDGIGARTMLRIRLFLMGQVRPMKMDDFVALFSWIFVGNTLFVLARTTAFVSVVIMIVNRLNFQEKVAEFISDLLSRATGFDVKVGAAVVPRWSDGAISLEDVTIVCNGDTWTELKRKEKSAKGLGDLLPGEVDLNWTYWDLTVDRIDVNLSLWRLLDGRGPIKEAKLKGIRGMVDRRHIEFDPNWVPSRRVPEFGDFEMDSFIVEDLLVTICNPDFRPFSFSIFDAELPIFRKQWLLYDMMCADSVVGMYDNCLFSVHRSQSLDVFRDTPGNFDKVSHLKMSSVPIDHLKVGATGPISWLTRGTVDLDLHVLIPRITTNDDVFDQLFDELDGIREVAIDKIEEVIAAHPEQSRPIYTNGVVNLGLPMPKSENANVILHWRVKLNDLKAYVPLSNPHLSYMSSALIRPVVAYMNANRTSLPLASSAKMDINNFNGAWDIFSAGLVDVLSEETGRALSNLVQDERERTRRLRRIGIWSLQQCGKAILSLSEYIRGTRNPWSYGLPI